jgi:uncharacterized protein (TIGR03067 family)
MLAPLLLLAAFVSAAEKTDAEKIQGTWEVVRVVTTDKSPPKETKEKTRVIIDARFLRFVVGKKGEFPEKYTLSPQKKPKGITLGPTDEKGIYELSGDDLKVCVPTGKNKEVKEFPNKPTEGVMLIVLKRTKPIDPKTLVLPNQVPKEVREVLDKAEQIELLSLHPKPDNKAAGAFYGYRVLGKTVLKDKKARQKLLDAFYKGVTDSEGAVAGCFNPRHGIRAKHGDKTTDLVICFECLSLAIHGPDKYKGSLLTTGSPSGTFNKILKDAQVPLPKE